MNCQGKNIFIYSNSRAALQAISNTEFTSRLVLETVRDLIFLGQLNGITLHWTTAHDGFVRN